MPTTTVEEESDGLIDDLRCVRTLDNKANVRYIVLNTWFSSLNDVVQPKDKIVRGSLVDDCDIDASPHVINCFPVHRAPYVNTGLSRVHPGKPKSEIVERFNEE